MTTSWQPQPRGMNAETAEGALEEKVVHIRRVAKVVKGGRHLSFNALVVVGDGKGNVGIGLGKANSVPDAVRKGRSVAQRRVAQVVLKGTTVPHTILAKHGAAEVLIKPAPPGTGIIAGASARAVLEQAGITDVITKSLRSQNPINVVYATMKGLLELRDPVKEADRRKALPLERAQEAPVA